MRQDAPDRALKAIHPIKKVQADPAHNRLA